MTTHTVTPLPALTTLVRWEHGQLHLDPEDSAGPLVVGTLPGGELLCIPVDSVFATDPPAATEWSSDEARRLCARLRARRRNLLLALGRNAGPLSALQGEALDELADLEVALARAIVPGGPSILDEQLREEQQVADGRAVLLAHARARALLSLADELGAAQPTGRRGRAESALTRAARTARLNSATATSIVNRYERRRAAWNGESA